MRGIQSILFLFVALALGCTKDGKEEASLCNCECEVNRQTKSGKAALLASRIQTLEELKSIVQIEYISENGPADSVSYENTMVRLRSCYGGREIISFLSSGTSQGDITKAKEGDIWEQLDLVMQSPYSISNRMNLSKIYILARWRNELFGWGDPAFYDMAKATEKKINTKDLAYLFPRDSSEKGYINSFNHVTAQAIITSCFSEEVADFIADVHERYAMPELINGNFTEEQLTDPNVNPIDNYVDIINNEWGQEMGKQLKEKYGIGRKTSWTPELLANYMNDLLSFYEWSFQIGFDPFRPEDEIIIRFSDKINQILGDVGGTHIRL